MIRLLSLLTFLSLLSCQSSPSASAEDSTKTTSAQIDSIGKRYLKLNRFSGTILVRKNDSNLYLKHFGQANYEEENPFTDSTAFKIGSASELITKMMIRDMVEKGQVKLTDTIAQHIPEIPSQNTIADLLQHQTQWPSLEQITEQHPDSAYSTVQYAQWASESKETSPKSELNYNVLGLLIERKSGKSLQENVAELSDQLELENTYFQKEDLTAAKGYLHHNYRGEGMELVPSPVYDLDKAFSSSGFKSTALDLAKILNRSQEDSVSLQSWMANDGFSYSIQQQPESATQIIVLSNRRHPVAGEISNSIDAILAGNSYRLPLLREAVTVSEDLLEDYPGTYAMNEQMQFEVVQQSDSLFALLGPNKVQLIPQSENQFFMPGQDAAIRFERDTSGEVQSALLLNGFLESDQRAKKISEKLQ